MVVKLNKFFIETLKLSPDIWLFIALGIVAVAFLVTLIVGLVCGEFKRVKGLMAKASSNPSAVIAVMQKMPPHISKQYKRARVANMKPSDLVTEQECVALPYDRSLISKVWIVTFVATVIAAAIAFCAGPIAVLTNASGETNDAALLFAQYEMAIVVLAVGGLLTLVGGIVSKVVYGGALKVFVKFSQAIDGDAGRAQPQQHVQEQPQAAQQFGFEEQPVAQAVAEEHVEEAQAEYAAEPQTVFMGEPSYEEQHVAAEPVFEPVVSQEQESDEEIRRRAREEALAQMRAQQEAQAAEAARQQAQQEEAMAQMRAQQEAQAQAAEAARQQAAQAQAQAQAHAQAQAAPSSADDVIARIEQIDREGAPRETMREVATLLQKERAKPENKTPEQQKRLNEALSKLLKAMSAASKK